MLTEKSDKIVKEINQRTAHMISLLANGVIFIQEYIDHVDDTRYSLGLKPLTEMQKTSIILEYETAKAGRR